MELVTDKTKLWYFPPDSDDDVPRYAIQTEKRSSSSIHDEQQQQQTQQQQQQQQQQEGIENGTNNDNNLNKKDHSITANSSDEFLLYDQLKLLTSEDILKIQPLRVNSDKMQVNFRNEPIGAVDFDNDEAETKLTNFVTQWKNGLKFLDQSASATADRKLSITQLKQIRQKEEKKRQKTELFKFLCSNLQKYIKPNDINVRIVTWNLQGQSRAFEREKENLMKLLNIGQPVDNSSPYNKECKPPDIYVINLQETVILNSLSFYSSPMLVNEWANFILSLLNENLSDRPSSSNSSLKASDRILNEEKDSMKYEYLVDNRLVGLSTIIIVRKYLRKQISNIEVSTTGTGILNMFGNKGAILIKFTFSYDKDILPYINDETNELSEEEKQQVVHGYKFVIVNTHLSAGDQNIAKRKKELQTIERNLALREYFKNESFYLTNPLLTNDYYNINEIDTFKFNDQETLQDNRLISIEDLSKTNNGTNRSTSAAALPVSPSTEDGTDSAPAAEETNFQDVPLNASSNGKKLSELDTSPSLSEKSKRFSRLASPIFGSGKDFPGSPTSILDAATFGAFSSNTIATTGTNRTNNDVSNLNNKTNLFHDCFIFFAGDLNFRLLYDINNQDEVNELKELLLNKQIDKLLDKDSLLIEKNNLNLLSGFQEAPIKFLPTYKCKVLNSATSNVIADDNNNEEGPEEHSEVNIEDLSISSDPSDDLPYNFERIPSYCDRVFFSEYNILEEAGEESRANNSKQAVAAVAKKHTKVNEYSSIPEFNLSDHKPVYLDLTLQNLQIIDFDERYKLMKDFLKSIDYQENSNKPLADVTPPEIKVTNLKVLSKPTEYEFYIHNKGHKRFSWEIVNYDPKNPASFLLVDANNDSTPNNENYLKEPLVEISEIQGIIPAAGIQKVKIKLNSLSIGIKKVSISLILRIISSKDFFLTFEFNTKPSLFGESLDLLNNAKGFGSMSGIPPSIYELINYLSNNLHEDMFSDLYDFNNKPNLKLKILNDLDLSIREQLENNGTLDQDYINTTNKFDDENSGSKAVIRTLLLLLNNLDGGIIPKEFTTCILDEITLPSVFSLNSNKFELQSDITTKILEYLPGLRANVFMYISSFLTLYISNYKHADKNYLVSLFEDALMSLPGDAPRAVRNKRKEVLKILL